MYLGQLLQCPCLSRYNFLGAPVYVQTADGAGSMVGELLNMKDAGQRVDIEFTLALNNRTGKYFFCKDLIDSAPDLVNSILYWRVPLVDRPNNITARILGRLALYEVELRRSAPRLEAWTPLIKRPRPVIFMDPREVTFHQLKAADCVVCHDVGPITHPDLYHPKVKSIYEKAFAKIYDAKLSIIFASHTSMSDFVGLYGDDFRSMVVISPPLRAMITDGPSEPLTGLTTPFLLTVGSIGVRKNQSCAIEAFRVSALADRGYSYVICGGPEPGFEKVAALADETPGVVRPGYVSDDQLRWLYRNAAGFVLPSLLEGFGLPAAEAIAYDLVPLVTQGGALHEVTGDAAILVDPTDVIAIAKGLNRLVALSLEERKERLRCLKLSASRFSAEAAHSKWRQALQYALCQAAD